jgi:hypothetical protein
MTLTLTGDRDGSGTYDSPWRPPSGIGDRQSPFHDPPRWPSSPGPQSGEAISAMDGEKVTTVEKEQLTSNWANANGIRFRSRRIFT